MTDLDARLRPLKEMASPDLWEEVERRAEDMPRQPIPWARLAVAALALAVAVAGIGYAALVFSRPGEETTVRPADAPPLVAGDRVVRQVGVAGSVAFGEGSIWAAATSNDGTFGGTIFRFDPATADLVSEIEVPSVPSWEVGGGGIVVADGSVWLAGGIETSEAGPDNSDGMVLQIDVATEQVVREIGVGGQFAADVAVDASGAWVTVFGDGGDAMEVVRIDPATGAVVDRIPLESSYARDVFLAGGAVWVHEREVSNSTVYDSILTKVDPGLGRVAGSLRLAEHSAFATLDGSIWAVDGSDLVRIDPATAEVVGEPVRVGMIGYGALLRPGEGGLWFFSGTEKNPVLQRFDPGQGAVDVTIDLPPDATPIDLMLSPGAAWVLDYEGSLTRIALRA
jgi:DNA-binding beta-propeller fold protein YncE